jgi:hypothetical protein
MCITITCIKSSHSFYFRIQQQKTSRRISSLTLTSLFLHHLHIISRTFLNLQPSLTCPFEEMGCMFAHETSDMCKFDKKCTRNLCSFGHTSIEEESDDKENEDNIQSEENEVEPCESCGELFDDIEDLIDHYGTTGHLK